MKPSSGLARKNTCSNFTFHTFCVLNTQISGFAACGNGGLLTCDVIMNSWILIRSVKCYPSSAMWTHITGQSFPGVSRRRVGLISKGRMFEDNSSLVFGPWRRDYHVILLLCVTEHCWSYGADNKYKKGWLGG